MLTVDGYFPQGNATIITALAERNGAERRIRRLLLRVLSVNSNSLLPKGSNDYYYAFSLKKDCCKDMCYYYVFIIVTKYRQKESFLQCH